MNWKKWLLKGAKGGGGCWVSTLLGRVGGCGGSPPAQTEATKQKTNWLERILGGGGIR